MTDQFADTACFIALLNPRDRHHALAKELTRTRTGRLVTTGFVLVEVANFLRMGTDRELFMLTLKSLANESFSVVLPADQALFEKGVALFAARTDKQWSLTDCISLVAMQEMQLTDALTSDHHFEQAGFRALLREQPPSI